MPVYQRRGPAPTTDRQGSYPKEEDVSGIVGVQPDATTGALERGKPIPLEAVFSLENKRLRSYA